MISPLFQSAPDCLALIPWCGLFILAAYLAYSGWTQAREGRTGRASQACQVCHCRDYGVSGAPVPTDDDSALRKDEVHDARNGRRPTTKGRQFSTATVPNHGSSSCSNESLARAPSLSLIGEDQNQRDDHATNAIAPGPSSSSRILSITSQAPPLHLEPLADLPWAQTVIRLSSVGSAAKRTWSVPTPEPLRANHSRTPSRYESLPHDPSYERTPPPSTKTAPLKTALYAGSKDLTAPPTTQWFILFIEVDDKQCSECNPSQCDPSERNPECNLHCIQKMFKLPTTESTSIYFESLAGPDATPENIKAKLTLLYLRAGCVCDDSMVLVFLSGTGDGSNRMRLLNDEVVTEDNLRGWISDVRAQSRLTNVQTVPIIFDICRMSKDAPGAEMCQLVELMWSCSLGQQAHAVGFCGVPNSCFLLALFWAAYDISRSVSPDFKKLFRFRLGQLVRIRRYSHDYWLAELGECEECGTGRQCIPPGPQDPEGRQAGWDVVASLGALIMAKYPEYVHNVVTVLTREMQECEKWEAERASSLVGGHRGASQPVAAGST